MPLRQEVLTVLLAQFLQDRGLVAVPEQVLRQSMHSVGFLDVKEVQNKCFILATPKRCYNHISKT
jgi:hypothetical protein